jgi:hypothetical protein
MNLTRNYPGTRRQNLRGIHSACWRTAQPGTKGCKRKSYLLMSKMLLPKELNHETKLKYFDRKG